MMQIVTGYAKHMDSKQHKSTIVKISESSVDSEILTKT
jgi:hypothetical protein